MAYPTTIKNIHYVGNGGPEVIKMSEVPFPKPASNELLIKMEWVGVNFADIYIRKGTFAREGFSSGAGYEGSGIIERLPTDKKTLEDEEYKARGFKAGDRVGVLTLGYHSTGAQYIAVPHDVVIPLPDSISLRDAAASLVQGFTALPFAEEAYNVQPGDSILVHAVSGGTGLALAQVLKARGAIVIGTTSSAEKVQLAKDNGVDHVIISTQEDVVKRVLELTENQGVHAIYDGIGLASWEANFEVIRRKGTIVIVGEASGPVPPLPAIKIFPKNLKYVRPGNFTYLVTAEEKAYYESKLWEAIQTGSFKLHIFKEYPFSVEGVVEAQTDLESRKTTGKLLIHVQ